MESIYKICIVGEDDEVNRIIVFSKDSDESPFNENERTFIESNSIPVQIAKQNIYPDDSIFTIKYKLLKELDMSTSYHELYLFSHIQRFHLQRILENIFGKTTTITSDEYKQLLVNYGIYSNVLDKIPTDKTEYSLEDITELTTLITDTSRFYKIPIGKRFRNNHNELFSANPFDMLPIPGKPELWPQISVNPLESFENQLLLNNNGGHFRDNVLYVCFAKDVFSYCEKNEISTTWATAIYFPLLVREDIYDSIELEKNQRKLISETKKKVPQMNQSIDILYDIYRKRLSDLKFVERGISEFSLIIHPEFKHILPLDVIFKNVHATLNIPFIKYNPGSRRENIYRLYSEAITKYGTKIPFLPPKTIIKLAKETGRNKQISFSIEHPKCDIYLHILNNGDISISGNNFKEPLSISATELLIQEVANPVIDHINEFLKKNGYELGRFMNLHQQYIEIEFLHWVIKKRLTKDIEYRGLQAVLESDSVPDLHKGAEFRYKRVENYSIMNEEDAFISGLFQYPREEIVRQISHKYELNLPTAALRLAQFLRDHEQQHGRFVKTSMKVSDSPGFSVSMKIESYENMFVCDFLLENSIADVEIEYVNIFSIYIDSFLRINEEPKSTGVPLKMFTKISAKKNEKVVEGFGNVLTGIETRPLYDELENDLEDELEVSGFGNLDEYETVDIETDAIAEYESAPEFQEIQSLSSLDEEPANEEPANEEPANEEPANEEPTFESLSSLEEEQKEEPTFESLSSLEEEHKEEQEKRQRSSSESSDSSTNSLMMMAEEEEEPEESEETNKSGGANDNKLDGMILKEGNNNLFLSKLKKKEPILFLSEDDGKYSAYSKICQASRYRQPVILTTDEKEEIDAQDKKNGSKSYTHTLEYGTDPKNKFHYICPRYWCLKTNKPISEKDAKAGKKCGLILPHGSKQVKPGHYIIEFNHPEQHIDKDGNYIENTPKLLDGKLHPKGMCMPCCFKKAWDSNTQLQKLKECQIDKDDMEGQQGQQQEENTQDKKTKTKSNKTKTTKQDTYIIDIRRYPLPIKRWGYLPISVQYFLQTDNSKAADKDNNKYLRTDKTTTTLLRYGVENSSKKSFIACIADIYAYNIGIPDVPTIQNMCDIIASVVSIDIFLSSHNGSLASIFRPKIVDYDLIDPTLYEDAKFMRTLDQTNETHLDFIYDTIAAYENFQTFLRNPDSYIDHTYLWDIVCSPNAALFPNGCNLAILRIRNVDMTDDIELLCPTAVYSPILFDSRKETVILIQHDKFFEPVYLFHSLVKQGKSTVTIHKTFVEERSPIKGILQIIRNSIQRFCPPKSSMPQIYKFARSLPADSVRLILLEYKFVIKAQVFNYHGKVVGLWIKYKNAGIYIPCFPSPPLREIPTKFMDDSELWMNYRDTIDVLQKVYDKSKGKILCRPVFKIMEDEQVIGVLTETNQFIMLSDPTDPEEDEIPILKDENYLIADKLLAQTKTQDPLRTKTIRQIRLETQFYSAFRTTVRIILNDPINTQYKKQIMKYVEDKDKKDNRESIETIIRVISSQHVTFSEFDEDVLDTLEEISDCFLNPEDKKYCALQNDTYQLILPKTHLVSGKSNSDIYYARVSDELLRYKRIQLFMLNAKTYLNLTNTEYKINANEMLLLESLLTSEYLKSLEPYQHGNTLITYETANPINTQKYSNEVSLTLQQNMVNKKGVEDQSKIECIKTMYPVIGKKTTSEWKTFFPTNAMEMELYATVYCSYYPIIYVYNEMNNSFLTVEQIKLRLVSEYGKYGDYLDKILMILRKQGKRDMVDSIRKGKYSLETVIMSEVYFLTSLDIWLLSAFFELPIILFHQNKLKHLIDSVNWLMLAEGDAYFFVRLPTEQDSPSNYLPKYTIVKHSVSSTSPNMMELIQKASDNSIVSLVDYLENIQ